MPNNTVADVNIKVLDLEVREITVKETDGSIKNKFNAYKTFLKNGKKIDVKFTRDVINTPSENCTITVHADDMNIDRNRKFPVLWVKKITLIIEKTDVKHTPADYEEFNGMFNNVEDLPF